MAQPERGQAMSHPGICPCPNCLGSGSKSPFLVLSAMTLGVVVWAGIRFSLWAGKTPLWLVGLGLATVVLGTIAAAIVGSVRSGRAVAEPVAKSKAPALPEPQPAEPAPAPVLPEPEVTERPKLRLVRDREVA